MKTIIIRFAYEHLRNEAHVEYHENFNVLVGKYTAEALGIKPLYDVYAPLFTNEELALDAIRKSELTTEIEEQDHVRDLSFRGFADSVKGMTNHYDPEIRTAARKIEVVFDRYGNISHKTFDQETAALDDLYRELETAPNPILLATLGLSDWHTQLNIENRKFDGLMMERYSEAAQRPGIRMKDARAEVDAAFRPMLDHLDALVLLNGPDTNKAFIAELNVVSERYKNTLAHHHARKDLSVSDHTVIEPIDTQPYSGKAVTVIPKVHYREEGKPTVELTFAVDFTVTYKNNVEVGTADLIINGKGKYKGQKLATFNIAR
jgi:hypothetical protein